MKTALVASVALTAGTPLVWQPAPVIANGIGSNLAASRPNRLPYERQSLRELRLARVRSIQGKYAHVPTSSEEFARRKWEELQQEG